MSKDQTMLKQMPLIEKKNYKKIIKCQEHYLKKIVIKELNTIIHNCQEHIKHQKAYKNNKLKKCKKQIQITKTTKKKEV